MPTISVLNMQGQEVGQQGDVAEEAPTGCLVAHAREDAHLIGGERRAVLEEVGDLADAAVDDPGTEVVTGSGHGGDALNALVSGVLEDTGGRGYGLDDVVVLGPSVPSWSSPPPAVV